MVITVYSVCSQLIVGELLLQQTDDFHLWKISAVTHICHKTKEREKIQGTIEEQNRTYHLSHTYKENVEFLFCCIHQNKLDYNLRLGQNRVSEGVTSNVIKDQRCSLILKLN